MEPTDRPETYAEQLTAFKVHQAARETAEANAEARKPPPRDLSNGQIYEQCPRCNGAMWPAGPDVCPACEREREKKWAANLEEERKIMQ